MTLATNKTDSTPVIADHAAHHNALAAAVNQLTVNVKDPAYGATGDGSTDDTAAFNSATSAAGIGGTLRIPPGTYRLDNWLPLERQLIEGAGVGVTILKAKAAAGRVVSIEGKFLAKLTNLTVDGNSKASDGVRIRGLNTAAGAASQRNMLERVRVTQCATGIKVDGAGSSDQVDKNLYIEVMIDNCTVGFQSATSNSQQQCFIGGSIDDCVTHAIKTNGTMTFIGWQAQQTAGGAGVTMMEFTGAVVDTIVMIDCITETHDITFDSGASNLWPLNGVQVYGSVLQANTHVAKIDRGGTPVALIVRGSRLNGGIVQLRGNSTVFVDEYNDPASTTTVTRTGVATLWHRKLLAGPYTIIASASTIAVPVGIRMAQISGTTNITSITGTQAGHEITLQFQGILTVTDGSNLTLAGNFVTTALDTLTLIYDGTNWYEKCRSVN